jgi:hypothetical protein
MNQGELSIPNSSDFLDSIPRQVPGKPKPSPAGEPPGSTMA